jgi:hypothetical protein
MGLSLKGSFPMHRHELDTLTDTFVRSLQAKLPPHLSTFGPASPERIREVSRSHVEAIVGDDPANGAALERVGPLVADLLGLLYVAPPTPMEAAPEAPPTESGRTQRTG